MFNKKILQKKINSMNGYYNLSNELREKFDRYLNNNYIGYKVNECFAWNEFCEVFKNTTYQHLFSYNGIEYGMMKEKNHYCFYTEGSKNEKGFNENYETPQKLLDNARIDGKSLQEVWTELTICS